MTAEAGKRGWLATWSLSLGFFLVSIDGTIVVVATPDLMASLGVDTDIALWVTSVYLLCSAAPLLLFGRLGDRYGRGRVYLGGLVGFILASIACALAPTIAVLIAARAVQGLAAAAMAPQSLAIIRQVMPNERLGAAMGLWGSSSGLANVLGPILGGVLVASFGWRSVFLVNLLLGLVPLVLALVFVPRGRGDRTVRIDMVGAALSSVGLALLVFAIQQGPRFSWGTITGPLSVPLLLAVGVAALVAFLLIERRLGERALLPLNIFRIPGYAGGAVGVAVIAFIVTAVPIPLSLAAQNGLGLTPLQAALIQLPIGIGAAVLAPVVGRGIDRLGPRPVALAGTIGYVVTGTGIGLAVGSGSIVLMVVATSAFGVANALVWASLSVLAMTSVPDSTAGPAAASYNAFRQLGAVLGSAGVAALVQAGLGRTFRDEPAQLQAVLGGEVAAGAVSGYVQAMSISALIVGVCGVIAVGAVLSVRTNR